MVSELREDQGFTERHPSVIKIDDELFYGLSRQIQSVAGTQQIDYDLFGTIEETAAFVSQNKA